MADKQNIDINISVRRGKLVTHSPSVGAYPNPQQGDRKIDVIIRLYNKDHFRIKIYSIFIVLPENHLSHRKVGMVPFSRESFMFKSYDKSPITINQRKETVIIQSGYEIASYLKEKGYKGNIDLQFVLQDQNKNKYYSKAIPMNTENWLKDVGRFIYYVEGFE